MHIISRKPIADFSKRFPEAKSSVDAWYAETKVAQWKSPAELMSRFPKARIIGKDRAIFNIGGNKFRLIVRINYESQTVFVRFLGTHAEYDSINPEEV